MKKIILLIFLFISSLAYTQQVKNDIKKSQEENSTCVQIKQKRVIEYKIIYSYSSSFYIPDDINELTKKVNEAISQGWELYGYSVFYNEAFTQVVVKYSD